MPLRDCHAQFPIATRTVSINTTAASLGAPARDTGTAQTRDIVAQCSADLAELEKQNPSLESLGCYIGRLKLRTSQQAQTYFGGFEVGRAIALTYGDNSGTLYTELLSDNLWLSSLFGYARVGLSTQVSGTDAAEDPEDPAEEPTEGVGARAAAVNQLFQAGGNANLQLTLPLAVWINFIADRGTNTDPVRRFDSALFLAGGVDVPALNAAVDKQSGNARAGVQTYFTWRTFDANFRFFAQGTAAYVVGFNDAFYQSLIGTDTARLGRGLGLLRGVVGVEVGNLASIGASFGTTTIRGVDQPVRLTVQLLDRK